MPYMIVKNGSQFCVHKQGMDKKPMGAAMGCHDNMKDATDQMRAAYANDSGSKDKAKK